jgi:hypothetical protein
VEYSGASDLGKPFARKGFDVNMLLEPLALNFSIPTGYDPLALFTEPTDVGITAPKKER